MEMSRISMLLSKLSILQMMVSLSLFAQYSHFPLTHLELVGIEPEKFPNFTSEFDYFEDIIDSSIFDSGTNLDFHSDPIESSLALKISNAHSDERKAVDVGISAKGSHKQDSNFAYIQNLADAQTIISPDSTDLISDIIYFLKDLFDDGNYTEENWLKSDYTLNGSKVHEFYYDRMSGERSIANTIISSCWGTLIDPEFQKSVETKTYQNHSNQGAKSSSNKQYFDNPRGDTTPAYQTTSTLSSNVQENRVFAAFEVFEPETSQNLPSLQRFSKRERRANVTYYWEMRDFNGSGNDVLSLGNHKDDVLTIVIRPLSSGTVGLSDDNSTDGTIGAPSNYPSYIQSGQNFSSVIQFTSAAHVPTAAISVDANAVEYYMNYYYGDWAFVANGSTNFDLMYYSQAPEPSTYVMTGALLCFIGFNQKSRNSLKKIFNLLSNKLNLPSCIEKLTRSQSHS